MNTKILFLLSLIIGLTFTESLGQKVLLDEWNNNFKKVFDSDTIYYYGMDLSKVRLIDPALISNSESIKNTYCPAWINSILDEIKLNDIRKYHNKKQVIHILGDVENRYLMLPNNFVISTEYSFPIDSVTAMIKSYKLNQKNGIGMVVIAESFNKTQESIFTYHVFFDISNRDILWAIKVQGKPKGIALSAYWGKGVAHNILFETQVYKKRKKKL
jgi:hypothetical protein